jgi:hypothetical protein
MQNFQDPKIEKRKKKKFLKITNYLVPRNPILLFCHQKWENSLPKKPLMIGFHFFE